MYIEDDNGKKKLNYNVLMFDHYLNSLEYYSTHIPGTTIPLPDWLQNTKLISELLTNGTITSQRERFLENEFAGESVVISNSYISRGKPQHSDESKYHDYGIMAVLGKFVLRDLSSNAVLADELVDMVGAHYMRIAGVMPDGRYLVYSWGRAYILDYYEWGEEYFIDFLDNDMNYRFDLSL